MEIYTEYLVCLKSWKEIKRIKKEWLLGYFKIFLNNEKSSLKYYHFITIAPRAII